MPHHRIFLNGANATAVPLRPLLVWHVGSHTHTCLPHLSLWFPQCFHPPLPSSCSATTATVSGNASSKLAVSTGHVVLGPSCTLYLRSAEDGTQDQNHFIRYVGNVGLGAYNSVTQTDGPIIVGNNGGALASHATSMFAARWQNGMFFVDPKYFMLTNNMTSNTLNNNNNDSIQDMYRSQFSVAANTTNKIEHAAGPGSGTITRGGAHAIVGWSAAQAGNVSCGIGTILFPPSGVLRRPYVVQKDAYNWGTGVSISVEAFNGSNSDTVTIPSNEAYAFQFKCTNQTNDTVTVYYSLKIVHFF